MTNEQTIVLLNSFIGLLSTALVEAEQLLPAEVERAMTWRYKGNNPLAGALSSPDTDPKLWEQVPGGPLCLEPFHVFAAGLGAQVGILAGNHGED